MSNTSPANPDAGANTIRAQFPAFFAAAVAGPAAEANRAAGRAVDLVLGPGQMLCESRVSSLSLACAAPAWRDGGGGRN